MPFEDSPSEKSASVGMVDSQPGDIGTGRKRLWTVAGILVLLIFGLVLANLAQGNSLELLSGSGTVTGQVVDENNLPVQAEVILLGARSAVKTDSAGRFELKNVPYGPRTLVVGYQGGGHEIQFNAIRGQGVDLGVIQMVSTRTPGG